MWCSQENTFIGGEIARRGFNTEIWIGLAGNGTSLQQWVNGNFFNYMSHNVQIVPLVENFAPKSPGQHTHRFSHTGAPVSFTNWERDPPSTSSRVCVRIGGEGPYKSLWKPGPCLDQGGFVCERLRGDLTAPPPAPSTTPDPLGCPAGTLDVGHHCIFVCMFFIRLLKINWSI